MLEAYDRDIALDANSRNSLASLNYILRLGGAVEEVLADSSNYINNQGSISVIAHDTEVIHIEPCDLGNYVTVVAIKQITNSAVFYLFKQC